MLNLYCWGGMWYQIPVSQDLAISWQPLRRSLSGLDWMEARHRDARDTTWLRRDARLFPRCEINGGGAYWGPNISRVTLGYPNVNLILVVLVMTCSPSASEIQIPPNFPQPLSIPYTSYISFFLSFWQSHPCHARDIWLLQLLSSSKIISSSLPTDMTA